MSIRLDSINPLLVVIFRQAPISKQKKAVADACATAASNLGLDENDLINASVTALSEQETVDEAFIESLDHLAVKIDNEYLRLNETGSEAALILFSKARVISALTFALKMNTEDFLEAIYEISVSVDDPTPIIDAITQALGR